MNELQDKVAIVTGASSGIGYETALLFASRGAKLIVSARRQKELDTLVAKITKAGGTAFAVVGDIKEEATAKALVEAAVSNFGGLHIAFNNAGWMGEMGPTPEVSRAGFEETIATNLTAAFLGAKYQVPAMLESGGGSIIFTSTFVGYTAGMPGMAAYAAAKSGLIGLTQVLAAEFGPQKVRVNALLPGGVNTPMGRSNAETPEAMEFVKGLHALKRIAEPEEIAQSALYLASDASSFTTGMAMLVDGGVSINRT
ncbi:3-oxoacyl-[acyl-carrier protein] reductase [hydrothermal vent metagenome]|uniref:3-oxoacyl-[acyl-carrier protein] reductase n=1 Tax=hydrothermal vent metagenome TaxID=652676 RepID=A0A3B0SAJ0_9ZZZZ